MTGVTFALRGLWFFRKSYLGVLAGSALGAMVLLGALLAGDSVRESLRQVAAARLGKVDAVLIGGDRMFQATLADHLAAEMAAPVLMVNATATVQKSGRTLGNVRVLGVDRQFWQFRPDAPGQMRAGSPHSLSTPGEGADDGYVGPHDRELFINEYLARSLELGVDQTLVLRFEKPGLIARDAPLAGKAAELVTLRGGVSEICGDRDFGRFSLESTQQPQATVFMPIERLQQALGLAGKANLLLLQRRQGYQRGGSGPDELLDSITRHCGLADYGLTIEEVPLTKELEIRSSRIFFDRQMAESIRKAFPAAHPVITYLANTISANGKQTPYSMVTAVDAAAAAFLPNDSNGVVLNDWEAADLGAKPGDQVRIDYYALENGKRLVERSATLPVTAVVPLTGLAADPKWMPDFPGVAKAEHAADWDAGVPIDLKRLRDKDEKYWDEHRGTPKLFLPLAIGRELFSNRWGEFTALRLPMAEGWKLTIAPGLLDLLTPATAGLVFRDVRGQGMAAAASPVDFAGLLLGMSLFLMVAAVALTAMLFRFHIERRNRESGLLDALGIPPGKVLRWRLLEGLGLVTAGCLLGVPLAAGYTRWLLGFLETIWRGPGGGHLFQVHVESATMFTGGAGFVCLMMAVIWRVTRRQARQGASLRLDAGTEEARRTPVRPVPWGAAGFALTGSWALAATPLLGSQGAFFLAGAAFLSGGLAAYRWLLRRRTAAAVGELTPAHLAVLNCGRRATRSLVVVGCLACGVFLVVAVAAFRQHGGDAWRERDSGAGGFAFWVETTSAANRGNTAKQPAGLLDLGEARGQFGEILPLRVGTGDDASCFNLNSVTHPRLLATDAATLAKLDAFSIKQVIPGCRKNWNTLREGNTMRAFVDETTLLWVLKKKPGEQLVYQDEWGRDFPIEIAGTLGDTVFQGSLVVEETRFLEHYPSAEGARLFLIESGGDPEAGRALLQKNLSEFGPQVTTTRERLAAFNQVENTYIAIFQVLGGFGVMLGSAGLGLITARNLDERRYEFAVLHAVGVPGIIARRIVLLETAHFIRWGLGIGLVAAMISIFPALAGGGSLKALGWLAVLVVLVAANAWFCSWFGFRRMVRTALNAQQEM